MHLKLLLATLLIPTVTTAFAPTSVSPHAPSTTSSSPTHQQPPALAYSHAATALETPHKHLKYTSSNTSTNKADSWIILGLEDPRLRKKVRRRPRLLREIDAQKKALKRKRKTQSPSGFVEGQQAAMKAIQAVLHQHRIDDPAILPSP